MAHLPEIKEWASSMERQGVQNGLALSQEQKVIAKSMGVKAVEEVRIVRGYMPSTEGRSQGFAAMIEHLYGNGLAGLTLGHCVFLRDQDEKDEFLAHEFRHVKQYEDFGSIDAFIDTYADQVNRYGYENSGLEQDARHAAAQFRRAG